MESVVHMPRCNETKRDSYDEMAQKSMLAYNTKCKDEAKEYKRVRSDSPKLKDPYKAIIKDGNFWKLASECIKLAKTSMWLLRLTDTTLPTLSKVR